MTCICIIPARYGSTRLPGKPLKLIGGKPMIQWVYEQAGKAEKVDQVLVATDHEKIVEAVKAFGGEAVLTSPDAASGTDRVAEVARDREVDVVINLQGDEPFISPRLLDQMVTVFDNPEIEIATPVHRIDSVRDLTNPNLVRVVRNNKGFALYFSRSIIPYFRDLPDQAAWITKSAYFKHIGLYAYRKKILLEITGLQESMLEKTEKLEQLRMLENGYRIYTVETSYESVCVDTEQDLQMVNQMFVNNRNKTE